jgi:hypothetical protein
LPSDGDPVTPAAQTGGVVGELLRADRPDVGGAVGATSDLSFALTSPIDTWSSTGIESGMRETGR